MPGVYTIRINGGAPVSISSLRLVKPVIKTVSLGIDTCTFEGVQERMDDDGVFEQDDIVQVFLDGVQIFYGRVDTDPRYGNPESEGISYTLVGPGWWLANLTYKVTWTVYDNGEPVTAFESQVILNKSISNVLMNTREQITDVINYAVNFGTPAAPIVLAPGTPIMNLPISEHREITCEEAILHQLSLMPDAVGWYDYSTAIPTLYIRRRSELTPLTLAIPEPDNDGSTGMERIVINPRYDLVHPAVQLIFKNRVTIDGQARSILSVQIAPPSATGQEVRCICQTIDLAGVNITNTAYPVETEPFEIDDPQWWKRKNAALNSPNVHGLTISDATKNSGLPRELIKGSPPESDDVEVVQCVARCKASYTVLRDPEEGPEVEGNIVWKGTKEIVVDRPATSAATGTYYSQQITGEDEPVPVGLAAAIYAGVSVLHFEGEYSFIKQECPGTVSIGQTLNLSGGRAEWATMNAVIQSVTQDLESGTTVITFGPPKHLGVADLIEILRFNRHRIILTSNAARGDGSASSGTVSVGGSTHKENTTEKESEMEKILLKHETGGTILIDASVCLGKSLKPREIEVCVNNVRKKMVIIASDPY